MNRAEMRRQKRAEAKADKIYHLTKAQLDQIVVKSTEKAVDKLVMDHVEQNFIVMMMLPCIALRDVYGFGKDRLVRFMDNVISKYECMIEDYDNKTRYGYDFNVFADLLKQETGFDVVEYLEKHRIVSRDMLKEMEGKQE